MKILVVEDDESFRDLMKMLFKEFLEEKGYTDIEVFYAENGEEAVEVLKNNTFEVISLDGTFPDLKKSSVLNRRAGLTLLERLQDFSHTGYVIFYSSAEEQVREAAKMAVAGRPVLARGKGSQGLSMNGWLELCVHLAKSFQSNQLKVS